MNSEFHYRNGLSIPVTIRLYGPNPTSRTNPVFTIAPDSTLVLINHESTGPNLPAPTDYRPAIIADTTTIQFDNLCYSEHWNGAEGGPIIQNIRSYTHTKRSDRDYLFYYTFDSTLLRLATRCP